MNTPATSAAVVRRAGFLLDDRGQHQRLVGVAQRRIRLRAAPRAPASSLLHRAVRTLQHRQVADAAAVGVGVGKEAALRRCAPACRAPPSALRVAHAPARGLQLRRLAPARRAAGAGSSLRRNAAARSVSSPCTILSSSRRGVMPVVDLVAAGADAPRLPGPAEPLYSSCGMRVDAGVDPGCGHLARRHAGFDRQLRRWRWSAATACSATTMRRPRRRRPAARATAQPRRASETPRTPKTWG